MPLIQAPPDRLARLSTGGEPLVAIRGDLLPDGNFGSEWLVVTASAIAVYPDQADAPRLRLELSSVEAIEAEALGDGGALVAIQGGRRVELLRYTAASGPSIGRVNGWLGKVLAGRKATPPAEAPRIDPDPHEPKRCPRCRILLQQGTSVCPSCVPRTRVLLRMLHYLRPQSGLVAWTVTLMFATIGVNLLMPWLSKPLFDRVLLPAHHETAPERLHLLLLISLGMLALGVLTLVVNVLSRRATIRLGKRLSHEMRLQVYAHVQKMSLRFFDKRRGGQLVARITQDSEDLEALIYDGALNLIVNVAMFIGIGAVLLWLDWRLTVLAMLPMPLVLGVSRWFLPHYLPRLNRFYHARGSFVAGVSETIGGMRVVKAFARERAEAARFDTRSRALLSAQLASDLFWTMVMPLLTWTAGLGGILVFFFGGLSVLDGRITAGTVAAFTLYMGMFYGPLQWLTFVSNYLARALASAARVFEVLDTAPDVPDRADAQHLERVRGAIAFEQVVFGYEKHQPVLKSVSFAVEPGKMLGLVGHSGAGKSTLINLLCRFYDVDSGRITVDGCDLRKLESAELRRSIGVVLQDTFLFNGTIAENIAYARPDASLGDIMSAAKLANAHDFIVGKPDGYDTMLGERGVTLSGGERQRLAIARAILHDPRILILDEATASVDTDTEVKIQEAIARLIKGRTTIAIAHRLSTLRHADRLLVLKAGEVKEEGTHEELLAKEGGEFRRLVEAQLAMTKIVEYT